MRTKVRTRGPRSGLEDQGQDLRTKVRTRGPRSAAIARARGPKGLRTRGPKGPKGRPLSRPPGPGARTPIFFLPPQGGKKWARDGSGWVRDGPGSISTMTKVILEDSGCLLKAPSGETIFWVGGRTSRTPKVTDILASVCKIDPGTLPAGFFIWGGVIFPVSIIFVR